MPVDLDLELDELFGRDLDEFVSGRNELAQRLRREGNRDEAERVKQLRKPTVSAWTVNQLARTERRQLDLLLDAGHRLREAQAGLLRGGDTKELERARDTQRDALRALAAAGRRILEERRGVSGPESTVDQVLSTLRSASVTESGRELLARGRLSQDVDPAGFEEFASLAAGISSATPRTKPDRARRDTKQLEAARKELTEARARHRELERLAREAERAAEKVRRDWERLREAAEGARAEANEAEAAVASAQERVAQAGR